MEAMDIKYKPIMFPNGAAVKKVKPAAVAPAAGLGLGLGEPLYRECLKNHAASLGGHAVDGCGEFMPSPGANPADPTSLKCAACGCHRNFHRRTMEGSPPPPPAPAPVQVPAPLALPPPPGVLHAPPHRGGEETPEDRHPGVLDADDSDSDSDGSEYDEERSVSPPPPHHHHVPAPVAQQPPPPPAHYFPPAPHMLLSLGSGAPGGAVAAAAQRLAPAQLTPSSAPPPGGAMPRKRFRTKFTAEQKQRMQELSERLGWRLQKRDEAIVDEWCRDMGVGKGVFKVWMHNNKHNFLGGHSARRSASGGAAPPLPHGPASATSAGAGAPSFSPSSITPPPPVLSSSPPPSATGFNINGAAASAPPTVTAGHADNATDGASSPPQSA